TPRWFWLSGRCLIKARLRRHSGLRREVATRSRRRPESPAGRALQHALAALRRLARATAIAGAPRLATACCSARRTTGELFRGSQGPRTGGAAGPPWANLRGRRRLLVQDRSLESGALHGKTARHTLQPDV